MRLFLLFLAVAVGTSGCGTAEFAAHAAAGTVADAYRAGSRADPDPYCVRDEKEVPTSPVLVDGILLKGFFPYDSNGNPVAWSPRALWFLLQNKTDYDGLREYGDAYSILDIGRALTSNKLSYIELEGPGESTTINGGQYWSQLGGAPGSRYVHYSVSKVGDLACAAYDAAMAANGTHDQSSEFLRSDQCVAAHALEKPAATYAMEMKWNAWRGGTEGGRRGDEHPMLWRIVNLTSHHDYAWLIRRENHSTVSCPKLEVRRQFMSLIRATQG